MAAIVYEWEKQRNVSSLTRFYNNTLLSLFITVKCCNKGGAIGQLTCTNEEKPTF